MITTEINHEIILWRLTNASNLLGFGCEALEDESLELEIEQGKL